MIKDPAEEGKAVQRRLGGGEGKTTNSRDALQVGKTVDTAGPGAGWAVYGVQHGGGLAAFSCFLLGENRHGHGLE